MSLRPPLPALPATATFCRVSSVDTLLRVVGSDSQILIKPSLPCVTENSLPLLLMSHCFPRTAPCRVTVTLRQSPCEISRHRLYRANWGRPRPLRDEGVQRAPWVTALRCGNAPGAAA